MTTDKQPVALRLDKEYEQINHPNGVTTWKTKPKVKPEALRLARELEQAYRDDEYFQQHATELRRLHALNQELLEALKEANVELEYLNDPKGFVSIRQEKIMEKARAAIAKAQGASNE